MKLRILCSKIYIRLHGIDNGATGGKYPVLAAEDSCFSIVLPIPVTVYV